MSINNTNVRFRVIFESREHYRLLDENKNTYPARISGSFRKSTQTWPTVGDWVVGNFQSGDWILIEEVQARNSVLSRKDPNGNRPQILAANVDYLFVVTSANQDLNLNRLDRYVAMAQTGGVMPIIVINKIELADEAAQLIAKVALRFPQIEVMGVSVYDNLNLVQFERFTRAGLTLAFVGSSGVGKSSLTNYLLGEARMNVKDTRQGDDRGRHTTTHRELHVAASGAVVIDTPGLRTVGLTDDTDLGELFSDIHEISLKCKFRNCQHQSEPQCARTSALDSGDLDENRWQNHKKMQRELAFEERKISKSLMSEEKKKWAQQGQQIRDRNRVK